MTQQTNELGSDTGVGQRRLQFSLQSLFVLCLLLCVGVTLTTELGPSLLVSVPVGFAWGVVAGATVGWLRGPSIRNRLGGILGAFMAHFAVLVDCAVSPYSPGPPWSLGCFAVLAPVGALCGALVASLHSRGFIQSALVGSLSEPLVGMAWALLLFSLIRLDQLVFMPTVVFSAFPMSLLVWAVAGVFLGSLTGIVIGLLNKLAP